MLPATGTEELLVLTVQIRAGFWPRFRPEITERILWILLKPLISCVVASSVNAVWFLAVTSTCTGSYLSPNHFFSFRIWCFDFTFVCLVLWLCGVFMFIITFGQVIKFFIFYKQKLDLRMFQTSACLDFVELNMN